MELILKRATCEDAELIWKMQIEAFSDLYEKYKDTDTSPATEPLEKLLSRLRQCFTYYYIIEVDKNIVGALRVVDKKEKGNCYLYEKMGFKSTGKTEKVNDKMTLVFYQK